MFWMIVTHILLGRPWLYDRDVYHSGKKNMYRFMFNNEKIVLKPMSAEKMKQRREIKAKLLSKFSDVAVKIFRCCFK